MYKAELDYCTHNSGPNRSTEELHCLNREKPLIRTLQPIAEEEVPAGPFLKEDDLFALGLESLEVTNLVRHINDSLERFGRNDLRVLPRTVYSDPVVHHFARTIIKMTDKAPSLSHELAHMEERMRSILEHFFKDLPLTAHTFLPPPPEAPKTVSLTDPAGTIGSHNLLANAAVAHIYCFTRIHTNPPFRTAPWCSEGKWFNSTLPTQS